MLTNNNHFSALLITSVVLSTNAAKAQESNTPKSKAPNILFICIDDLRTQIGAYGHDYMKTPNLDKIASEGRLFTNQYVQVPTSGASRACMLTGHYPVTSKDVGNKTFGDRLIGSRETDQPETFIHHLRRNGYYTVGMGKVSHNGDGHVIYKGNRSLELPHSWDRFANDAESPWSGELLVHGYANGEYRRKGYKPPFETLDVPDEGYPDGRLANLAMKELEVLAERDGDDPFFMAVGFYKPHLPFCAPLKYWQMYDDVEIELPENKGLPEGVDLEFIHRSGEFRQYTIKHDAGAGVILPDDYARDLHRAYYAALSYTDAQVGKVISKLEELGLDENTIIVVWGDHGWCLGEHTIWGKHNVFDQALNSTFMVKTPNMKQPGVATDQLVGAIDIYPTICDLAGVTRPEGLDGVSFRPILDNPKSAVREEIFSYWSGFMTVRTPRYRMSVRSKKGDEPKYMLFDHKKDPLEMENVMDKSQKASKELRAKLEKQNRGFLGEL